MNNQRRKAIREIADKLDALHSQIGELHGEEEEAMENMPENMQYNSDRWDAAEEAVDQLDTAMSSVEEAFDALRSIA